jgi:hypothetical protein
MSGMGSHTRVTPTGFKISTCVVTSNTRHLPAPSVFACVNRGSVDTTATVGRAKLAFKNARLCTIILLHRPMSAFGWPIINPFRDAVQYQECASLVVCNTPLPDGGAKLCSAPVKNVAEALPPMARLAAPRQLVVLAGEAHEPYLTPHLLQGRTELLCLLNGVAQVLLASISPPSEGTIKGQMQATVL